VKRCTVWALEAPSLRSVPKRLGNTARALQDGVEGAVLQDEEGSFVDRIGTRGLEGQAVASRLAKRTALSALPATQYQVFPSWTMVGMRMVLNSPFFRVRPELVSMDTRRPKGDVREMASTKVAGAVPFSGVVAPIPALIRACWSARWTPCPGDVPLLGVRGGAGVGRGGVGGGLVRGGLVGLGFEAGRFSLRGGPLSAPSGRPPNPCRAVLSRRVPRRAASSALCERPPPLVLLGLDARGFLGRKALGLSLRLASANSRSLSSTRS
jgi:hypothetical protein